MNSLKSKIPFIIKYIIVPLVLILIALRVFIIKTTERELFYSTEAFISREEIEVGSEGYGNISSIDVSIGDYVNKGDILYKYYNAKLDEQIFNLSEKRVDILLEEVPDSNVAINSFNKNIDFLVRAKRSGIVKEIDYSIGDYITKDNKVMVIESADTYVATNIKVPVEMIDRIRPGLLSYVKLTPTLKVEGSVSKVYPKYDAEKNLLSVDVLISNKELARVDLANVYTGSPAEVVIVSNDTFTQFVKDQVNKLNINWLRRFLTYEII
jgi:multidrug resistance efflux pump